MNYGMPQTPQMGYYNPYPNYYEPNALGYQKGRVFKQQEQNLSGRYVNQPKEIAASEVPMDGTIGYFPTYDQQFIYAKAWNADGKIETGIYKLVKEEEAENIPNNYLMESINERLERIEKMLTPKPVQRKKGDAENE